MKIGIIGSGNIGGTLAQAFAAAGHEVMVSNSRGPETLSDLADRLGSNGRAGTAQEAAGFGDVVVVSIPLGRYRELPADELAGKVVLDTINYYPSRDGRFAELDQDRTTSSELVQQHLGARLVKVFNAIFWEHLRDAGRPAGDPKRLALPISGDDAEAKQLAAGLIDEIGVDTVDAGDLASGGRKYQTGAPLYGVELGAEALRQRLQTS
jgi:8-hydroxy-5-deazaflavin:NADPH oxidoreductase